MQLIKHILVVVDPATDRQPCVEKGARIASALRARLELFSCDDRSDLLAGGYLEGPVLQAALDDRRAQLNDRLHALSVPLREAGLSVSTDCKFRSPLHRGVIEKAKACHADLVIKDTHFHSPIQRALFTNTDWHLIRELPVPLMLTKPAVWQAGFRVAAALDPGHQDDKPAKLDRELVEVAAGIAAAMRGEVLAVHAFNVVSLIAGMAAAGCGHMNAPFVDAGLIDTVREFHRRELQVLLAGYPAFEGREALIEGAPEMALPEFVVQQKIDLLVTGAVSRSPLRRLVVGSTAERLLDRLPCDILVVKPLGSPSSGASREAP